MSTVISTRRREKQETIFRSVNGIGFGSVVIWGGVMAIATIVSISSAIKLRRRKTHPPPPPPLPPDFTHNKTLEIKQQESECLTKGFHDLLLSDLKGKAEPTEVARVKETETSIDGMIKKNPILEEEQPVLGDDRCLNHEEYHETNPDQDEKEKGEDGKYVSDNFEEETKRGVCEEEVDEITMEEYRAAENDSTEDEDEDNEEDISDNSESKKMTPNRIEGQMMMMMEEVKSESEKENQHEHETESSEETETETGDSSSSSNVEGNWSSESSSAKEMCVHLKSTHMGLTDIDQKLLKRKARGNRIDENGSTEEEEAIAGGSNKMEIVMKKNWSKLRIMIVMILVMALLLPLVVNTVKKNKSLFNEGKFSE